MSSDRLTVQRTINARPATVFSFFTDHDRWLLWQGLTAHLDPRPGGVFRINVTGHGWATPSDPDAAVLVVTCACGQQWRGNPDELIPAVQQHGLGVHNMPVTPEQVVAMARPSPNRAD